jgi:hypothetical protein
MTDCEKTVSNCEKVASNCEFCFGKLEKAFWFAYIGKSKEEGKEVACFLHGQPYSWNVVFIEVWGHTEIGREMLVKLKENEKI